MAIRMDIDDFIMEKPTINKDLIKLGNLKAGCTFSKQKKMRYELWRSWAPKPKWLGFILYNPSTADDVKNDQTIKSCINIAESNEFTGIYILNWFAKINPIKCLVVNHTDIGKFNDYYIERWLQYFHIKTVAAWGKLPDEEYPRLRIKERLTTEYTDKIGVRKKLSNLLHCLGHNNDGSPKHPLYLPRDTPIRLCQEITGHV